MASEDARISREPREPRWSFSRAMRRQADAPAPRAKPESSSDPDAVGVRLAHAIGSLTGELRQAALFAQREYPWLQLDPVELELQVALSRAGTGWRVLAIGDGRYADVAHTLKLRWHPKPPKRNSTPNPAEQASRPAEPVPDVEHAPKHYEAESDSRLSDVPIGSAAEVLAPSGELVGLARITVYEVRDKDEETGRLLIKREVITARNTPELTKIKFLRTEYERADDKHGAEKAFRVATADYFAEKVQADLDITWWETRQTYALTDMADVLDNSAEWLRDLVERPLTAAANAAGLSGPMVSIWAGITANAATARLTAPLENVSRVCEVVGIFVGLVTGMHPLVVACANRLLHDQIGRALAGAFERVFNPALDDHEQALTDPHSVQTVRGPDEQAVKDAGRSTVSEIERDELEMRIDAGIDDISPVMPNILPGQMLENDLRDLEERRNIKARDGLEARDDPSAIDGLGFM